jgi:predicted NBD/HSP70 family sugar kinase
MSHRTKDDSADKTAYKTEAKAIPKVYTATPSSVRNVNRAIVLHLIRVGAPLSRVELSERTGIVRSNVSDIVDRLVKEGLLREERSPPAGPGRVPTYLYLNEKSFHVLGINIRPLNTTIAFSGLTGKIRSTITFRTPRDPRELVTQIRRAAKGFQKELSVLGERLLEFGISVPGFVNWRTGVINWLPALPEYSGFPLEQAVFSATGVETSVDNDCNLGALAELWRLEKRSEHVRDFAFLEIGELGVGGGIIFDREVYRGNDSLFAGEFGHMSIDPNGPKCDCGRRGCWQLYVCDRATLRRFRPHSRYTPEAFERFITMARSGDKKAMEVLFQCADYLSLGISNIMFGLNPSRVILAGRIGKVWDLIERRVIGTHGSPLARVPVWVAPNVDDLFMEGAINLALSRAFANPRLGV